MATERPFPRQPLSARLTEVLGRPAVGAALALGAIVVGAIVVRVWLNRKIAAPWIMTDELSYSELAKSFASTGDYQIGGQPTRSPSALYPILIAPAWLTGPMATTYELAKAINVVLMASATIPLYLWAQRLVPRTHALAAVVLTLTLPSFFYTGNILTESAFLPAFVLAAFAIALALERPTLVRQGFALGSIVLACAVRIQGVVLVAVLATAIVLKVLLDLRADGANVRVRSLLRGLWRYRVSLAALAFGVAAFALVKTIQGVPLSSGLGRYRAAAEINYPWENAARWVVIHLAELGLTLAIVPVSALIVLFCLSLRRGTEASPAERAFLAVTAPAVLLLVIQVGIFASRWSERIEERNMFYVAPLLLLGLLVWIAKGLPRPPRVIGLAVLVPAALLVAIPFENVLNGSLLNDTFGLQPFLRLAGDLAGGTNDVRLWIAVGAIVVGLVFALVPARAAAPALLVALAGFLGWSSSVVLDNVRAASASWAASAGSDPSWIDERIGSDSSATYLYSPGENATTSQSVLWQTQFWNRSVKRTTELGTETGFDGATGKFGLPARTAGATRYVVINRGLQLSGRILAKNGFLALYEAEQPPRLAARVEGVYADGWMSAAAAYDRWDTPGGEPGTVEVLVSREGWGGPDVPGNVLIEVGPLVIDELGVAGVGEATSTRTWVVHSLDSRVFRIPTPRPPFRVEIQVDPTFSPAELGGLSDSRALGAQVTFSFLPKQGPAEE